MSAAADDFDFLRRLRAPGFHAPAGDDQAFGQSCHLHRQPQHRCGGIRHHVDAACARPRRDGFSPRRRRFQAGGRRSKIGRRHRPLPCATTTPAASRTVTSAPAMAPPSSSTTAPVIARSCARGRIGEAEAHMQASAMKTARRQATGIRERYSMVNRCNGSVAAHRRPPGSGGRSDGNRACWQQSVESTGVAGHAFCSPQKVDRVVPGVGLLACGEQPYRLQSLHLPRSVKDRVVVEAMCPHLQWRNRAGFTPDFPVMPIAGTQGRRCLYHSAVLTRKRLRRQTSRAARALVCNSRVH